MFAVSIIIFPIFETVALIGLILGSGRFIASCYLSKKLKTGLEEQEVLRVQQLWAEKSPKNETIKQEIIAHRIAEKNLNIESVIDSGQSYTRWQEAQDRSKK